MYAIIESGGKQHRVHEGQLIDVEYLQGEVGDPVHFEQVSLIGGDSNLHVGKPLLEGARVVGSIAGQEKGKKVLVFKFKRRKGYRRKIGHRQWFTRVRIDQIELKAGEGGQRAVKKAETPPAKAKETSARPAAKKKAVKKAAALKGKRSAPRKTAAKSAARKAVKAKKTAKKATKTRKK